ncbi:MAG TPA: hypothetical protein PKH83_10165, partial [Cyclobacteriaceae bacterium]|nr:hypothetical protein [Cyclobacteriaceae bacterium]
VFCFYFRCYTGTGQLRLQLVDLLGKRCLFFLSSASLAVLSPLHPTSTTLTIAEAIITFLYIDFIE